MSRTRVGAFEAKTRLSEVLEQVTRGHTFVMTRRGRPVAELRPVVTSDTRLTFGCDKGQITISDDFDAPLPDFAGSEQ